MRNQSGQSLIELLIAMSVFVLVVSAIAWLIIDAYLANRVGQERTVATFLAQEGIEAVRSMRDSDFDNLTVGTHGLVLSDGSWTFSGTSDTHGKFTRQVIISEVAGEIDQTDIKKIESRVSWEITPLRQGEVVLTTYLTDWRQTQGDAGELSVDISEAVLGGGNKTLQGIKIQNTGSGDITVDKMTVWWNNTNKLDRIRIEIITVFDWPPGVPSGTEIDIINFILWPEWPPQELELRFNGSMKGTDFIIKFIMTDGSTKYVLVDL